MHNQITFYILMDYPIYVDTRKMVYSILYFKGHMSNFL